MNVLELPDYSNPYAYLKQEMDLIQEEIDRLDDNALMDECLSILVRIENKDVDKVADRYLKTGKLSKEDRKKLEGFYLLTYTELCWRDDGAILHIR